MNSQPTRTESATRFADELLAIIREQSYRDPMLHAVCTSAISRAGVRVWALQASFVVREFTRFVSAIHANCPSRDAQQMLAENLWEEHGRGVSDHDHYALIRKLARALGASDDDLDRGEPLPETADYINHCLDVTRNATFVESMTALGLGVESLIPRFFGRFAQALCAHYGLSGDDVQFLLVHVTEDEDHSRRALELIEAFAETAESQAKCRQALREMLTVKRRFAEALYRQCLNAS